MKELDRQIKEIYIKYDKEKTYEHVLKVAQTALSLAKLYDVDVNKVKYASLLHDISAIINADQMYEIARKRKMNIDIAEAQYHFLLHQRISKIIANEYFFIEDEDILSAIECHTTLKKDAKDIDKIVFLADKLSWDQEGQPPYYDQVQKAISISLDEGCYVFMKYQFDHQLLLKAHHWLLEAYQQLENNKVKGA